MTEKKKCWVYLRAWSREALEAQREELLSYASALGYEVSNVAVDCGPLDGSKRNGLEQILHGAANRDLEVLLIHSWRRLGRDLSGMLEVMTSLRNHGVEVHGVKENSMSLDRMLMTTQLAAVMQDEALYDSDPVEHMTQSI